MELIEVEKRVTQEISRRQKAEEALRALEDMYRTLLKTFPDAAAITDLEGNITEVSMQMLELYGYEDVNELIGESILQIVAPEDREKAMEARWKVLKEGFVKNLRYTLIKKDGTRFIGECDASFVTDTHGKYTAFIGISRDITQRIRTEREIKALKEFNENIIENSPIGIHVVDGDLVVKAWNSWFEDLTGVRKCDVLHKNLFDIIPASAKKEWIRKYQKVIETGQLVETLEYEYLMRCGTKDGDSLYLNSKIVPLKHDGSIVGAITVVEDITEHKKAKDALLKSREQLFQAQKMEALGTLVAGVAHEINNPLNLIMYNIPLFKKIWQDFEPVLDEIEEWEPGKRYGGFTYDFLKENMARLLSDTDMATNRMARIVSNFKNFAKQSSIIDKEPIQINTAVKNAMRLAGSTLGRSRIDLNLGLDDSLPAMEGNLQNVEQIILNLILNAVQAIDHEQGKIEILTAYDKKGQWIRITVSDNGKGIDPSIADILFDPFVSDKQAQGGSGMGLAVTYALVKAHDGEITFESKEGEGTTFKVSFPPLLVERRTKILVVDDDDMVRSLLTEAFTGHGSYSVEEASSGLEACIKLGTYHPDLMIIDIVMPEMDGLEICRVIVAESELSDIKVLVTTGFPNDQRVKQVLELGFTNIYFKPFDVPELLNTVDRILKG